MDQNITNNSPSNILQNHSQFQSYRQKHHRSRQQLLDELQSNNGLMDALYMLEGVEGKRV